MSINGKYSPKIFGMYSDASISFAFTFQSPDSKTARSVIVQTMVPVRSEKIAILACRSGYFVLDADCKIESNPTPISPA